MARNSLSRVLITGVNGQDGAYLAQRLLSDGLSVFGTVRNIDSDVWRLKRLGIDDQVTIVPMTFDHPGEIDRVLAGCQPDWVVNLAAISSLGESEANAELTRQVNFCTPRHLFREFFKHNPLGRVFQASSALVFGCPTEEPQTEATARQPDTYYGMAKNDLDEDIRSLRSAGFFAVSGILYNHESPLRGADFVSTKIVEGLVRLKRGVGAPLNLGNLEDVRDWSHARDFASGIELTMTADSPDDWIFASGCPHKVFDWIEISGRLLEFEPIIAHDNENLQVVCEKSGMLLATARNEGSSPAGIANRVGNPENLKSHLGWVPKYDFESLAEDMVNETMRGLS